MSTTPNNPVPSATPIGPWLMVLGIAGIVLATLGASVPVLSCLLIVGLGADADLARRTTMFEAAGLARLSAPLRGAHASLYVWLYAVAWLAMMDTARSGAGWAWLLADLSISLLLLSVVLIRSRRAVTS